MDLRDLIRRVERESGLTRGQLARMSGLSVSALLAWTQGERTPRRGSLDRLASGLEHRARVLLGLAAELRAAGRSSNDREAA